MQCFARKQSTSDHHPAQQGWVGDVPFASFPRNGMKRRMCATGVSLCVLPALKTSNFEYTNTQSGTTYIKRAQCDIRVHGPTGADDA